MPSKLAGLIATAVLLVSTTAVASAATTGPETAAGTVSEMSLEFTRTTTRQVGSGALVFVRCAGSKAGLCTGVVNLSFAGNDHKIPFSVVGGASQGLVVPLGPDKRAFAHAGGQSVLAVAGTAQPLGAYAETTGVLRIR